MYKNNVKIVYEVQSNAKRKNFIKVLLEKYYNLQFTNVIDIIKPCNSK